MSETNFEDFFEAYVKAKDGKITFKNEIIYVTYPDKSEEIYTYHPVVGREMKVPLISPGSPAFQQVLRECQENGGTMPNTADSQRRRGNRDKTTLQRQRVCLH